MRHVALLIALSGCMHNPDALRTAEIVSSVGSSLYFAGQLAAWQGGEALDDGDVPACVGFGVASAVALSASDAVVSGPTSPVLPSVKVDVSRCGPMPAVLANADADVQAVLSLSFESAKRLAQIYASRMPCRTSTWISGVLSWCGSAAPAIFEELRAPDGIVVVPEVSIDLSACGAL